MDSGAVSKINQDRGCVVFPFGGQERQALFCCFDGHGEKGDVVSNMVMNEIQKRLEKHPKLADDPPKVCSVLFCSVALRCVALRCVALRCVALRCVVLCFIVLL